LGLEDRYEACENPLIGPSVHASHGMERTHYDGIEATIKLLIEYINQ